MLMTFVANMTQGVASAYHGGVYPRTILWLRCPFHSSFYLAPRATACHGDLLLQQAYTKITRQPPKSSLSWTGSHLAGVADCLLRDPGVWMI